MFYKHGFATGEKPSRIYRIWIGMKGRINNPNNTHYKYYGGRGITICAEWYDFLLFYNWSMRNEYNDNLTIDRIDGDGNYEPNNCRWVTKQINNKNKKYRPDVGIFKKKRGYYFQQRINGIYYCGGYSEDINEVRKFKEILLHNISEGKTDPQLIPRKTKSRDEFGQFTRT